MAGRSRATRSSRACVLRSPNRRRRSWCPMPEAAAAAAPKKFVLQQYKTEVHVDWCPGCGDFGILSSIQQALFQLQIPPYRGAMIPGIGCSRKTTHHDDTTYIVFNNGVYGLTKGQASPTLAKGLKTKSMPEASIQEGVNPIALALGAGYTWIGRVYALDVKTLVSLIVQAINHKGTSFLDIFQTCPVYNDLRTKEWYAGEDIGRARIRRLEADPAWDPVVKDPSNIDEIVEKKTRALRASYETQDSLAVGVFYSVDLPTYDEQLAIKVPALKEHPLVDLPLYQRDVDPLFGELA